MSTHEILQKRNLKKKQKHSSPNKNSSSKQDGNNPYLVQKIMSASQEQLILYIYDAAIKACKNKNLQKAEDAIQELTNSLDFEYEDIANTFYNTYQAILHLIRDDNFDEAHDILKELRDTWAEAMDLTK